MKAIIQLENMSDLFSDLMSYVRNYDPSDLMELILSDVNGVLGNSVLYAYNLHVDPGNHIETLNYVITEHGPLSSEDAYRDLWRIINNIVLNVIVAMAAIPNINNKRFKFIKLKESNSGNWTLYADIIELRDNINELPTSSVIQIAEILLAGEPR